MKRALLVALIATDLLSPMAACAAGSAPRVLIVSRVIKDVTKGGGPYTLVVDAYDNTAGQPLHHEEHPVVGEYGPASLEYPSGHHVDVTVTLRLGGGLKIPIGSYIKLTDGGLGGKEKSCTPVNSQLSSLECKLTTRF